MIFDSINNTERYLGVHPGLKSAFEFLKTHPISELKEGKNVIDGDYLFALVLVTEGKGKEKAVFEAHRKYIDIQYTVSGTDFIGWDEASRCTPDNRGYNPEKDIVYYSERPELWITVPAGHFAVFFPHDAHAPLGTDADIHKIVVKVAENWKE
jgi:YhcH/YjgK/YiaL family protein